MAAASAIYGGGGTFFPESILSTSIPAGALAGTIFSFTPPAGKRIRIYQVICTGSAVQGEISIVIGPNAVINNATLGYPTMPVFSGVVIGVIGSSNVSSYAQFLDAKPGQSISIVKGAGAATTETIRVTYGYGE
jgi:hypothetical protein